MSIKSINDPTVTVITASIGSELLPRCAASVAEQTYPNVRHCIVVDGEEYRDAVFKRVSFKVGDKACFPFVLPQNTGGHGYLGHRIYAAVPMLLNCDFIVYLDEDNWLEPEHIQSLMDTINAHDLAWAYALRNIVDLDGHFICKDDCDSLGIWGQWYSGQNLIDTSCYLMKRELAVKVGHLWHRKGYCPDHVDADRAVAKWLLNNEPRGYTSGRYTVNYRLGGSDNSAPAEFFLRGNEVMQKIYREFPWQSLKLSQLNSIMDTKRLVFAEEFLANKE